ncbi:MAG: hypothetical protein Q9225_002483 [Loekoesia sp. 1 TL-2023]
MIFCHLFPKDVSLWPEYKDETLGFTSLDVSTAVLRVCKLFNHEATPILYGKTTFRVFLMDISGQEIFKTFTTYLGPSNTRAIASIEVRLDPTYDEYLYVEDSKLDMPPMDFHGYTELLPGLKEIRIRCRGLIPVEDLYGSEGQVSYTNEYIENEESEPRDFSFLEGIAIVVEPERVNYTPIDYFRGNRVLPFIVRDNAICIDRNKLDPRLRLPIAGRDRHKWHQEDLLALNR